MRSLNVLHNNSGSSLVESLISMLIIIITALGGIALYFNASEVQRLAQHKKIATEIAKAEMEKYRSTACSAMTNGAETPQTVPIGGLDGTLQRTADTANCKVLVEVTWNETGQFSQDYNVSLVSYVR